MATPSSSPLTYVELDRLGIEVLRGVGDKRREALAEVGVRTVLDLLTYYPRRWIDRTAQVEVAGLEPDVEALVLVHVVSVSARRTRNRRSMVTVRVGDDSGRFEIVFFNQPWRERQLRPDLEIAVFGRPTRYRDGLQMTNPVVDLVGDQTGRIVPVYPQSEKAQLTSRDVGAWIREALRRSGERGIDDPVPSAVLEAYGLIDRDHALRSIHAPATLDEKDQARRRLAFDELFRVQLVLIGRKRQLELEQRGVSHRVEGELLDRFLASLPYPLTDAQHRVIGEISDDLAASHPMHRLLQGDVGAGKTVVAVATLLAAVQGGHQGALMAPTEVLAEQHAAGLRALLDGLQVPDDANLLGDRPLRVELITSRTPAAERREMLAGLVDGSVDIAIGTHALIQEGVEFRSLGAVVVDEQHRFGVEQRAALREKGAERVPDLLVMTATPIPRTAAMTVYGDLDVSILDELPPGRTPIETRSVIDDGGSDVAAMWDEVNDAVASGRQAFVVCPLIEESDKLEIASAQETFEQLRSGPLAGLRLGLLHGRMASSEKHATMEQFRLGNLDVLVATTVIEVGVDVPNATVMVILDADRFGIAQLHQLRGRVGRGSHASTCWLVTGNAEPSPRIDALVSTTDGFELAEIDLELRGEGTLMSSAQKGRSDLKLASLRRDRPLVEAARQAAVAVIDADWRLEHHARLRSELEVMFSDRDESFLAKS